MNKGMWVGLVAIAFVAGSLMTGTMAEANNNQGGGPLQAILDAILALDAKIDTLDAKIDALDSKTNTVVSQLDDIQDVTDDICDVIPGC